MTLVKRLTYMTIIGIIIFLFVALGIFGILLDLFQSTFRDIRDEWRKTSRRK